MRYFGGKSRIAKDLAKVLNPVCDGKVFVDLFCGACNVVENITKAKERIANDNNPYLIALMQGIQDGWVPPKEVSAEEYNHTMNHLDYNPVLSGFVGVGCSFGGGWNNGYGRNGKVRKSLAEEAYTSLLKQKDKLDGVCFTCNSYDNHYIPESAVVYCDPPYRGTSNKYYDRDFDYDKFLDWVEDNKDKYDIYISEYKENLECYPSTYEVVWEKDSSRCVRAKHKPGKTTEVLIHAR